MPTRRDIIIGAGAAASLALLPGAASATPLMRDEAIAAITKGAAIKDARVTLTLPPIAENGLSVYMSVVVDSPMTQADHVRAIHIISEQNPIAQLMTFHLTPRSGVAKVATNMRLATTQKVTALVEMSDGSFWRDQKSILVTIAACVDGG